MVELDVLDLTYSLIDLAGRALIDPGDRVDVFDNYLVGLDVPDHYLLMFGQVVPPDHVLTYLG